MEKKHTFEEKLRRLEELSAIIKKSDVPLEEALKVFEEGIKLSRGMEKELDELEGKIQILMNNPPLDEESEKASSKKAAEKADASADESADVSADAAKKNEKPRAKNQEGPVLDFFDAITEVNGTRA